MTVESSKVVDLVGIDKARGDVVLTIADHLEWGDDARHLLALRDKLNSYLAFIESGELVESYPNGAGLPVRISVVLKNAPSAAGKQFFQNAQEVVEKAGFSLEYRVFNDGE